MAIGCPVETTPAEGAGLRRIGHRLWNYARELYLYTLVGGFVLGLDVASFYLLMKLFGVHYFYAHCISRTLGGLACFALNRGITFKIKTKNGVWRDIGKFLILYSVSFGLSSGLIYTGVQVCHLPEVPAKIASESIVFLFNYTVMKYWVMIGRGGKV